MVKNKKVFFVLGVVIFGAAVMAFIPRTFAEDVISQPDFSSSQAEPWGSFAAAIGIASGSVSEFGTTTAALGDFMTAYLGWECGTQIQDAGAPFWCGSAIPLTVATTTILGTGTKAYVFQNPHQAVDGEVELFYVDFYGGTPVLGFGTPANTTPNLSWRWTCGPYCRNGGTLGGTSNYFVPYFEMGPQADPPSIASLSQSVPDAAVIPEHGTVFGRSVSFSAALSAAVNDPLVLQVEIEPLGASFTGTPTATSTAISSTGRSSVVVPGFADGDYRWAARAVDASTSESSAWTYFDPSSVISDFTVRAPKEPVIFIPGIVGSRLVRASDGNEVWPDVSDMFVSPSDDYLDDLALAPDGSQMSGREMAASSIIDHESVLGISIPFYDNALRALEADGYSSGTTLFTYPYDWRLSVKDAGAALANTVAAARAASSDGKISIIGYSMGGLIAKEYLAGLSDVSFVDKLVLVGAPQLGAPEAFKVLNYGDNLGFQIPVLDIDILNHTEAKKIAQNMPSIYDLLPSRAYMNDNGGYVQDFRNGESSVLDYDATNRLMVTDPLDSRNGRMFGDADAFHGTIDGLAANAPDVYNIVGCSEPTISEYHIYDNGVVDVLRNSGDGTVPLVSAMDRADGFKNYFISGMVTGITHTDLVSDSRTLALITAILDGKASSFALPDGFSTELDSCFGRGTAIEFSAHGATGLTVQDDAGSSTGMDASGTVDLGIPDSTYEAIGRNYFITVPSGGMYRLMIESSSSDDLIVKAKAYDAGSRAETVTYVVSSTPSTGQDVGSGTTTAKLDFIDFATPTELTVTKSGASSSDNTESPNGAFSVAPVLQASGNDVVPPEMAVSGVPATATIGSTTTIFFSATDPDSGVAWLRATLNGAPVTNGDTVTFAQAGNNIFRAEAMDNAGNPSVKEIDFMVSAPPAPRTESFLPIGDTYIDAANPGVNYGGDPMLRLRARGKDRALIRFDQAAILNAVGSSTIVSAKLTFTVAKNWENWVAPGLLALYRMTAPWTEANATWNSENPTSGVSWATDPSATTTVANDTTSTVSFDVTADIQAFLNGIENDGWILRKIDECAPGVIDFGSRESGASPSLTVMLQ